MRHQGVHARPVVSNSPQFLRNGCEAVQPGGHHHGSGGQLLAVVQPDAEAGVRPRGAVYGHDPGRVDLADVALLKPHSVPDEDVARDRRQLGQLLLTMYSAEVRQPAARPRRGQIGCGRGRLQEHPSRHPSVPPTAHHLTEDADRHPSSPKMSGH